VRDIVLTFLRRPGGAPVLFIAQKGGECRKGGLTQQDLALLWKGNLARKMLPSVTQRYPALPGVTFNRDFFGFPWVRKRITESV
jgi:hypothetical protein